jgi:hypothetical protein
LFYDLAGKIDAWVLFAFHIFLVEVFPLECAIEPLKRVHSNGEGKMIRGCVDQSLQLTTGRTYHFELSIRLETNSPGLRTELLRADFSAAKDDKTIT